MPKISQKSAEEEQRQRDARARGHHQPQLVVRVVVVDAVDDEVQAVADRVVRVPVEDQAVQPVLGEGPDQEARRRTAPTISSAPWSARRAEHDQPRDHRDVDQRRDHRVDPARRSRETGSRTAAERRSVGRCDQRLPSALNSRRLRVGDYRVANEQRRLARRHESLRRVRAEGRAGLVEVERAEHAAVKEAVLAAAAVASLAACASPRPFAAAPAPRRSRSPLPRRSLNQLPLSCRAVCRP